MEYMSTSETVLKDVTGKLATKESNVEPQQSEGVKEQVHDAEVMMAQVRVQCFISGDHTFAFLVVSKIFFYL